MIGSTAQHQDILSAVLAVVTNPDMVKKNIEALQAKITESEAVAQKARDGLATLKEAETRISALNVAAQKRESDTAARERAVQEREKEVARNQNDFVTVKSIHAANVKANSDAAKVVTQREQSVTASEASVNARNSSLDKEQKKRTSELDAREQAVAAREKEITTKFEKLKQLAG